MPMRNRCLAKGISNTGKILILLVATLHISNCASSESQSELFSAQGYRLAEFRAPVPDSVPSASTLSTEQLQRLLTEQPVLLIDVLPTPIKPKDRPEHLLWLPPARKNIPGSYWLPNVGFGALSDELDRYFRRNLAELSKQDSTLAIVIYCLADCWMSWNAAMRAAVEYGYSNVYWYPDGTTGWEAKNLPLQPSQPIPID
ncbi:MAG: PQQ-dependent catabolism-associated CXXCW motif protein [Candidatus Thiodiazotropha taylori]|nr:PQQ-dependent catabolism-associated CXXCW motif protein [Candidatus Thiodiazotropha taylori]MCG8057878.1 PQQ-dependent catabolism-associated CXXCW motif protein [Candidatus Thiodiazotropha taylori]MCW4311915.1 PQQ-dependent catabolism-associated CXXCW motif protein [Candidatus Thiodiazotropha taylori]MCW4319710.1 PQQ-dependent catabolism-associated CXXCW motif protein [Candidatus Thiodiazotropha taylori]